MGLRTYSSGAGTGCWGCPIRLRASLHSTLGVDSRPGFVGLVAIQAAEFLPSTLSMFSGMFQKEN